MLHMLLLAADDHAAHGGHGAESAEVMAVNWLPAATALGVFLIAFAVLYAKVWPMIVKGLDDRQNKIRDEIKSAEEARHQARAALEEYERELATAREEASQMIAKARADAKAAADALQQENEATLAEMKARARREIDAAKSAAISELHAEATSLAVAMAGKILQREISVDDQQHLVEESLRDLAAARSR